MRAVISMQIIDTHVYVVAHGDPAYPQIAEPAPWVAHAVGLEGIVSLMDACGVAGGTLIQALQAHGYDNRYTLDSAHKLPQRLVAVGMYDPQREGEDERLRQETSAQGMRGARITPRDLTSEPALHFWQVAQELDVPVVIAAARPGAFPAIDEVAMRFPGVRLLLEGLGLTDETYEGPPFSKQQPLFDLAGHANVYLKWCTDQLMDMPDPDMQRRFFRRLIDVFGAQRIMWGSRYPYRHEPDWTYASQLQAALAVVEQLDEKERRLLMGESALAIWPELASAGSR